ncbi:hypothetical protein PsorP6_003817 [Peronosclerospora sorghi]|uniref:Uncharacterized protein n=1 Tax=Peronosclerospora sorghi TaxID=230839 RepID=A0ACC0VPL9_9STRA|nr:hypothetical protein PsorP6_003817 [Peronosclerospora sorghi]
MWMVTWSSKKKIRQRTALRLCRSKKSILPFHMKRLKRSFLKCPQVMNEVIHGLNREIVSVLSQTNRSITEIAFMVGPPPCGRAVDSSPPTQPHGCLDQSEYRDRRAEHGTTRLDRLPLLDNCSFPRQA